MQEHVLARLNQPGRQLLRAQQHSILRMNSVLWKRLFCKVRHLALGVLAASCVLMQAEQRRHVFDVAMPGAYDTKRSSERACCIALQAPFCHVQRLMPFLLQI